MEAVKGLLTSLFGWLESKPQTNTSRKRDRVDDDVSSDEEIPSPKRNKHLKKTIFPGVMTSKDILNKEDKQSKNVRYVPIQIETSQPSTSTPIEISKNRVHTKYVPGKYVIARDNRMQTPSRKPRMHTPVTPITYTIVDDDEDDVEGILVETDNKLDKQPTVYVNLEEEENEEEDNDVVVVEEVTKSPPQKAYKFFISKNNKPQDDNEHYKLKQSSGTKSQDDNEHYKLKQSSGTKSQNRINNFREPLCITKSYRKPSPVANWMQSAKTLNPKNKLNSRSSFLPNNGQTSSTLREVFNLNEKKNYRELIRQVTESMNRYQTKKKLDIINLVEDASLFRKTQQAQKQALNEIIQVETGATAEKEKHLPNEYDHVTVASINSSDSEVDVLSSHSTSSSSVRVPPSNSLREYLQKQTKSTHDLLSRLDDSYRSNKQRKQDEIKKADQECKILSKANAEHDIAYLKFKLKHELSLPESLIEEPQLVSEFPTLTQEQENQVTRALGSGPGTQVLIEKFNLRITRNDLHTLAGANWLNDEVINFYMNLLMQRSNERQDLPKVYATNTFFYPKLMQSGHAGLRRWTRRVDVFAHDLMVVPVHLGVHWCLSLVDFREKKISYLDSMGGKNEPCLSALMRYLREEHQDKKGKPFDDTDWTTQCLSKQAIPQQMNGSDCGMFACTYAEFACRDAEYTFTQSHMPYLRRKAALEILTGKLIL